jgi:heme exporter protein C
MGGPAIDPSILTPLLVMALAFTLLFATLLVVRMRAALMERKIRVLDAAANGALG